jgi:hypothetical protein
MEIIWKTGIFQWIQGNIPMCPWDSFHGLMATIPFANENHYKLPLNHSMDPWKSLEGNVSKGLGSCNVC